MRTYRTLARAQALLAIMSLPASVMAAQLRPHGPDPDPDDEDKPEQVNTKALIHRLGGAEAAVQELSNDNFKLRNQRRDLRIEVKDLKAKMPAEGTVVLSKEEAADYEAYKKIGKPTDIEKQLKDGKDAAELTAKNARTDGFKKAAADLKYNPEVLAQLADLHKLTLSTQTVQVDGKDVSVHTVTPEGGQPLELSAYAKANFGSFLPSLTAQGEGGAGGGAGGGEIHPWLSNGAGGASGGGAGGGNGQNQQVNDMVAGIMKSRSGDGGNVLTQYQPGAAPNLGKPAENQPAGTGGK